MVAVGVSGKTAGNLHRIEVPHRRTHALALVDDAFQIFVVHFLLLVRDLEKALVDALEFLVREREAQLAHAMAQRRVARARREDDLRAAGTHVGRVDDLVGVAAP